MANDAIVSQEDTQIAANRYNEEKYQGTTQ